MLMPACTSSLGSESLPTKGIVTPRRTCGPFGGPVAKGDEENQLRRLPVPARDHSAGDLALSQVHTEPARRRRFARGAWSDGVLRDSPALGESFRTDGRCRLAKAPPQAAFDLASGRSLSEGRPPHGLSMARRRCRGRGPRCVGAIQAKQACRAETDAKASVEIRLRSPAIGHGRLAVIRRRGPRPGTREPTRTRTMEEQSGREFASANPTAGAQDATLQERRLCAEIPLNPRPRRRL